MKPPSLFLPFLSALLGVNGVPYSNEKEPSSLPIVELPYVKQQATSLNITTGKGTVEYYAFRNIRYAAAPLGELRFNAPAPPEQQDGISDGTEYGDTQCHQVVSPLPILPGIPPQGLEMGSEDCLFLDVYVPAEVFSTCSEKEKVPVLGWWHGGGYLFGSKDFFSIYSNPSGLFETAAADDSPLIFVSANYRLGAFGWLSQPSERVTPNAGLYDTLAAMKWIRDYIHLFGGDASRFTAMGESAGGGLLMHALTSFGGEGEPLPFQRAIIQSGAWFPDSPAVDEGAALLNDVLDSAECADVDCLFAASTEALTAANAKLVRKYSSAGLALPVGIGPQVDGPGGILPDMPLRLVQDGRVHQLEAILSSNTRHEAATLLPVNVSSIEFLAGAVKMFVLGIEDSTVEYVLSLYDYAASPREAAVEFVSDVIFTCPARLLNDVYAYSASIYRYIFFATPVGGHADDVPYTFGPGSPEGTPWEWHVESIVGFVTHGEPAPVDGSEWQDWGDSEGTNATWVNATAGGVEADPWGAGFGNVDERCAWLGEYIYGGSGEDEDGGEEGEEKEGEDGGDEDEEDEDEEGEEDEEEENEKDEDDESYEEEEKEKEEEKEEEDDEDYEEEKDDEEDEEETERKEEEKEDYEEEEEDDKETEEDYSYEEWSEEYS